MGTFGVKVLEETSSPINGDIKVVRSLGLGTYIQVEGLTQSGGLIVDVWKAALKKLKNSQTKTLKNCLILGLGGGSAATLVTKFWPKVKVTGIDIDPVMVSLGKKYLKLGGVDIEIADAYDFAGSMVKKGKKYDLILVDTYLGHEYPKKFESEDFLRPVNELLTPGGVAIFNRLYYGDKRPQAVRFGSKLEKTFPRVEYLYPQANLMLICSATIDSHA